MTRRWLLVCLLLACKKTPQPAPVKAVVAASPSADVAPRFRAALKRGQKLEAAGDHSGAMAAYREALELFPEHPQALDEMGVSAYHAQDLAAAEGFATRAVKASRDPRDLGRALYNLGRVQEARGTKDAAIESYRRSLEARPNAVVQKRLAVLDPKSQAKDPIAPDLMEGPFAKPTAWCKQAKGECTGDDDEKPKFTCERQPKKVAQLASPLLEVEIVDARCAHSDMHELVTDDFGLAVKVGSQWYVGALGSTLGSDKQSEELEIGSIEARPLVAGGAPRLVVSSTHSLMYRGMDATTTAQMAIAGVGPSGKPSLTGPIILSYQHDEDDPETGENKGKSGGELTVKFLEGEVLVIGGPTKIEGSGIDSSLLEGILGKHPLRFP